MKNILVYLFILLHFQSKKITEDNLMFCENKSGKWEVKNDKGHVIEIATYPNIDTCITLPLITRLDTLFDSFGIESYIITYGYTSPRVGEYISFYSNGDTMEVLFFAPNNNILKDNKEIRDSVHRYYGKNNCLLYTEFYNNDTLIKRVFTEKDCDY